MDPYTLRGQEDQPWSKETRRGARFQKYSEVAELRRRNTIVKIENFSNHPIKKEKRKRMERGRVCRNEAGQLQFAPLALKSRARLQASL